MIKGTANLGLATKEIKGIETRANPNPTVPKVNEADL